MNQIRTNYPQNIDQPAAARFPMPVPFGWYAISFADDLKPGELKPLHYFGREMVLFRTESGEAHVIDAFCAHLGAHLGYGGKVKGDAVSCPFHGWRWNGAGQCIEIPYAQRIPPLMQRSSAIHSYPTIERNRFIYVWYHPENKKPLWDIPTCAETTNSEWSDFKKFSWVVKSHIQEQAENSVDSAHFRFVHGTVNVPRYETTYDGYKRSAVMKSKMRTPRGNVDGAIIIESAGPGFGTTRFTGICETVLLSMTAPIDVENTYVCFAFMQKKVDGKEPVGGVHDAIIKDICKQMEEDIPIWEHKKFFPQPSLCDGDGPIMEFRRYYRQFYLNYDESEKKWRETQQELYGA